jgi:hypothetical protein
MPRPTGNAPTAAGPAESVTRRLPRRNLVYNIKWLEETGWAVLIAVAVFVLTAALGIETVSDWKAWAISLGTGSVRIVAATVLNQIRKMATGDPA